MEAERVDQAGFSSMGAKRKDSALIEAESSFRG
jgi:hypothetical protein